VFAPFCDQIRKSGATICPPNECAHARCLVPGSVQLPWGVILIPQRNPLGEGSNYHDIKIM